MMQFATLFALVAVCTGLPRAPTIVELAEQTPELSTLVAALKAGGLVDTLSGPGPFTVFAPTNDAFDKIPREELEKLLEPSNKATLDKILTYHVAAGKVLSSELHNYEKITTVEGGNVTIFVLEFPEKHIDIRDSSEGVAHVIKADIVASNGVVHLIDKVLIPGSSPAPGPAPGPNMTIVELAASVPTLSTLVTAVKAAGLVDTLSGPGPFTVFAPTNDAFSLIPEEVLKKLLEPENKEELVKLLTYHVVSGNVQAKDIKDRQLIKTVEGEDLLALVHAPHVYLQDRRFEKPSDLSEVVQADVEASNGVVHVVNHVLIPEGRLL